MPNPHSPQPYCPSPRTRFHSTRLYTRTHTQPRRFNPYTAQQQQQPGTSAFGNYNNSYRSPMSSPPRTKRDVPPKLPSKKQQRSQSLTPVQPSAALRSGAGADAMATGGGPADKYCSADGVCRGRPEQHMARSATETRRLMMMGAEKCNSADGVIQAGLCST